MKDSPHVSEPRRPRALLILTAALMAILVAPAAAAPPAAFGPDETGCPSFFSGEAEGPTTVDPGQVGPFGTSQQRLSGMGIAADGETLTVSLRVEDMRRQAAPGFRWAYWEVFFGVDGQTRGKQLEIYYDMLQDDFSWWAGPFNGTYAVKTKVDGTVTLGPDGGVAITVPFEALQVETGDLLTNLSAEAGSFISYVYMSPPDYLTGTFPSGIYAPQWTLSGPELFLVMPCPGIVIEAFDLTGGHGASVTGGALPAETGQAVRLERETEDGWTEIGQTTTGYLGMFSLTIPGEPGPATLRATVTTRMLGEVTSAPVTVTLTG